MTKALVAAMTASVAVAVTGIILKQTTDAATGRVVMIIGLVLTITTVLVDRARG